MPNAFEPAAIQLASLEPENDQVHRNLKMRRDSVNGVSCFYAEFERPKWNKRRGSRMKCLRLNLYIVIAAQQTGSWADKNLTWPMFKQNVKVLFFSHGSIAAHCGMFGIHRPLLSE